MENEQNKENLNEEISNDELYEIRRDLELQQQLILESLARQNQNETLQIRNINDNLTESRRKAAANAVVCGVGSLVCMSFAQVAVQKLGLPNMVSEMQTNYQNFIMNPESTSLAGNAIEYMQNYVRTVFGPMNEYLSFDNLKEFVSTTGPVGCIAGLISAFSAKNAVHSLKEWRKSRQQLNAMAGNQQNRLNIFSAFTKKIENLREIRNMQRAIDKELSNTDNNSMLEYIPDDQIMEHGRSI